MKKTSVTFLAVLACFAGKFYLQRSSLVVKPKAPDLKPILASYHSQSLDKNALGFNMLLGAGIWVTLLQNSDYNPVSDENVSWEFTQLDSLTTLDPNNSRAYDYGSIFISVLRRDKLGGKLLLEKWTKKRTNFWKPWYLLGSHYFLELKDYASAAPLILKASTMANSPSWLSALGVRLLSESGQYYQALHTSLGLLPFLKDPEGKKRLLLRIRALNYQLQKKYWNDALTAYYNKNKKYPDELSLLRNDFANQRRELSSLRLLTNETEEDSSSILDEQFPFKLSPTKTEVVSANPEQTKTLESLGIFSNTNKKETNSK